MTPSKIFFYFCLAFIAGIFLNSFFKISLPALLAILIFGIILISVFWQYKKLVVIGFCVFFLVLGVLRHHLAELKVFNSQLRKLNGLNQETTLIGKISAEPDIREKNQRIILKIEKIELNKKEAIKLDSVNEKVLAVVSRYPEYQYGDRLIISGKLEAPKEIEDFNYQEYLAKDGIYSIIYFPKIEIIERESYSDFFSLVFSKVLKIKNKLRKSIYQNLSPPQSSLLGAMILGDKKQLSEELKEKLNLAGVRHITAVSGLHVGILTSILMPLLIGLGFWRQQAFYFAIILMTIFIIMTGLQPSAIRAGIMAGFFLLAQYLGRISVSNRIIIFTAAVMLVQNPFILKLDVGFQLSFLAMMGIIYFSPILEDWLREVPQKFQLKNLLAITLSAQIFTLPILIYNFGYFSLVAPLTNILIVPLLPYIMGLGFIFGLAGIIFQPLGWLLSLPLWLLLSYIIKIIDLFSQPWALFTFKISWFWLVIFYLGLGLITWRVRENQRLKFLKY